ncbi:MAG: hypothetical protein FD155_3305 [Bacteroidetes bacterium]|nr:MAG: hypothetical protein FD155_3305 [Bacteroidota bacterium]
MKRITFLILLSTSSYAFAQLRPQGTSIDSSACNYAPGLFSYYIHKNNEMIGLVAPDACNFAGIEEDRVNTYFVADFYPDYAKDTFATQELAFNWLTESIEDYYKPLVVEKWDEINVTNPHVSLRYPLGWSYVCKKFTDLYNSNSSNENQLVLMRPVAGGNSQVFMIIRTPNSADHSTEKSMELTAWMNRAIDIKNAPRSFVVINGKSFVSISNTFMYQMVQYHFWYADKDEIIYINYNLLKDEQIRFPVVMKSILDSIVW